MHASIASNEADEWKQPLSRQSLDTYQRLPVQSGVWNRIWFDRGVACQRQHEVVVSTSPSTLAWNSLYNERAIINPRHTYRLIFVKPVPSRGTSSLAYHHRRHHHTTTTWPLMKYWKTVDNHLPNFNDIVNLERWALMEWGDVRFSWLDNLAKCNRQS